MANKLPQKCWAFRFVLEAQDGQLLPYLTAEELLDHIIASVEERGLQIGGGFRESTEAEANPAPFPLRGPWREIEEESRELASAPLTFTFFSEKEGSTIIEQFSGNDLGEAVLQWYGNSIVVPEGTAESDGLTPVDTVMNVWCMSGFDRERKFFLTHVVPTLPATSIMRTVFVLHHTREDEDGYDNDKLIGVYSSKERAERVVESYRGLPGFSEYPDGFSISAYEIDKVHWTEEFVDLSNS